MRDLLLERVQPGVVPVFSAVFLENFGELDDAVVRDVVQPGSGLPIEGFCRGGGIRFDDREVGCRVLVVVRHSLTGPHFEVTTIHDHQLPGRTGHLTEHHLDRHDQKV